MGIGVVLGGGLRLWLRVLSLRGWRPLRGRRRVSGAVPWVVHIRWLVGSVLGYHL